MQRIMDSEEDCDDEDPLASYNPRKKLFSSTVCDLVLNTDESESSNEGKDKGYCVAMPEQLPFPTNTEEVEIIRTPSNSSGLLPKCMSASEARHAIVSASEWSVSSSSESDEDSEYDLSNPEAGMYYASIDDPSEHSDEDHSDEDKADVHKGKGKADVRKGKGKADVRKGKGKASYEHSDEDSSYEHSDEVSSDEHLVRRGKRGKQTKRKATKHTMKCTARKKQKPAEETLPCYAMDVNDSGYTNKFAFSPNRDAGIYLPPNSDTSERGLFELFFSDDMVAEICRCSDEYAQDMKDKKPYAYKHYKSMTKEDFYKLVGIIIHFGYRKIPQYRFAWRQKCLCHDPFVASVMSRNRFDSLLAFLHVVDKATEADLKKKKDKLAKVSATVVLHFTLWLIVAMV